MKLREATTSEEILEVLSRRCWHQDHDGEECPGEMIPTPLDLADYLIEVSGGNPLGPALGLQLAHAPGPEPWLVLWSWVRPVLSDMEREELEMRLRDLEGESGRVAEREAARLRHYLKGIDRSQGEPLVGTVIQREGESYGPLGVAQVHAAWCGLPAPRPPHPLTTLVRTWQKRPRRVDLHRRVDPILPTIRVSEPVERTRGRIFGGLVPQEHEATLPLFPEVEEATASVLADVPLLALSDATGAPVSARGRGAELSLATLVRGMTLVGLEEREYGIVEIAPSVRDMRDALWPNGWERRYDWPRLRQALRESRDRFIPLPGGRSGGLWWQPICRAKMLTWTRPWFWP